MAQQQQLEKRRQPLTLPQPSDLAAAIGRDWREPKKLQLAFDSWVKQQHPVIEVLTATIAGSGQGAFLGGVMGALTKASGDPSATLAGGAAAGGSGAEMAKQMAALQAGGPLVQARNFAVMTGVNAGIATACRKARGGVEDVYSTMVAAFGSGAAFSLVSGMGGGGASTAAAGAAVGTAAAAAGKANPMQAAFTTGCFFALFQGAFYKIGGAFGGGNKAGGKGGNLLFEGPEAYARATYMLQTLDLAKFEKNIKRAQLSDATLLLWTEASLAEAKVPPGPRLLILNHLDHYRKNMMKPGALAPGQMPPPPPPPLEGGGGGKR